MVWQVVGRIMSIGSTEYTRQEIPYQAAYCNNEKRIISLNLIYDTNLISTSSSFSFTTYLLMLARKGSGPQTQTRADFRFFLFKAVRLLSRRLFPILPLSPSQQPLASERMWVTLNLRREKGIKSY